MRYHGGKARSAAWIGREILRYRRGETRFVSLFCGGLSVEVEMASYFKEVICSDNHPYLMAFWQELQKGWEPPKSVSEKEYRRVWNNRDENPALTGFVGFAMSWGGKFFGGYARRRDGERDYCTQGRNTSLKKINALKGASFLCSDYRNVSIRTSDFVYCDPPYEGKQQRYGKRSCEVFDSAAFWKYIRELSRVVTVLVSEENAPSDFVEVWSREELNHLRKQKVGQRRGKRTERLFISEERLALLNMGGSTWDVDVEKGGREQPPSRIGNAAERTQ